MAQYWFRAKRYGWGWAPAAWQGWVTLIAFVVLIAGGSLLFPPGKSLPAYLVYVLILAVALVGVCWLKGEPPRWRWGNDSRTKP